MIKKLLHFKVTLTVTLFFITAFVNAQCLTATEGQWPTGNYTPETCDGTTENVIDDLCFSSEFSKVVVTIGQTYVFSSSLETDFITISNNGGTTAFTSGVGSVTWVSTINGNVRFYLHDDASCAGSDDFRSRIVKCGTPPVCASPIVDVPYTMGFETGEPTECITIENVNGSTTWSIFDGTTQSAYAGTKSIRYNWNGTNPGNDWFYTSGLNLTGGTTYTLQFYYKASDGPTYVENLDVKYGTAPNAASMTSGTIVTLPGIATALASPFAVSTTNFTPTTSGVYYIGFHNTSIADQAFLYVDNITVDTALSNNDFTNSNLNYYPNPVKNVLNLSDSKAISEVKIFNLLGQEVISKIVNSNEVTIDMSSLSSGNYIAKVTSGDDIKVLKIVKQ